MYTYEVIYSNRIENGFEINKAELDNLTGSLVD
jgi:hypothetical protein